MANIFGYADLLNSTSLTVDDLEAGTIETDSDVSVGGQLTVAGSLNVTGDIDVLGAIEFHQMPVLLASTANTLLATDAKQAMTSVSIANSNGCATSFTGGVLTSSMTQNLGIGGSGVSLNDLTLTGLSINMPIKTNGSKLLTSSLIDVTTDVTGGPLSVAHGGTGSISILGGYLIASNAGGTAINAYTSNVSPNFPGSVTCGQLIDIGLTNTRLVASDASQQLQSVTISNTNTHGMSSSLSFAGSTLTAAFSAAQDLSTTGDVQFHNLTLTGSFTPSGDLLPVTDNTYNIGSVAKRWLDGHFSGTLNTNDIIVSSPVFSSLCFFDVSNKLASLTLTNGQLAIGNTGLHPSATTLTSGASTNLSIVNGAGSITLDVVASPSFTTVTCSTLRDTGLTANEVVITDGSKNLISSIGGNDTVLTTNHTGALSWVGNIQCDANNTVLGNGAGTALVLSGGSTGSTIIGHWAGHALNGGGGVLIGEFAGLSMNSGSGICIGTLSAQNLTGGDGVYIGQVCAVNCSTETKNVCLGNSSGIAIGNSGVIVLGDSAVSTASHQCMIGDSSLTTIVKNSGATCDLGTSANAFSHIYGAQIIDNALTATTMVSCDASKQLQSTTLSVTNANGTSLGLSFAGSTLTLAGSMSQNLTTAGNVTFNQILCTQLMKVGVSAGAQFYLYDHSGGGNAMVLTYGPVSATADRLLTVELKDADRTLSLGGDLTLAKSFTTSGAFNLTLTTTAATNVTLPTTGTLATLAGVETLSNKSISDNLTFTTAGKLISINPIYIGPSVGNGDTTIDIIGIGRSALASVALSGSPTYNGQIAIGPFALTSLQGINSGGSTLAVTSNIAIGFNAMKFFTGNNSTASPVTFGANVAIGASAMRGAAGSSNACTDNTAIGNFATFSITSAIQTVCVGSSAGANITSGSNNTLIGFNAGNNSGGLISTGSDNTLIGSGIGVDSATAVNRIAIGRNYANTVNNTALIGGSTTLTYVSTNKDNVTNLGDSALQWKNIYLGTQLINSATTSQIQLGTTNTTTLSFLGPASSRVITVRDALAASDLMQSTRGTVTQGTSISTGVTLNAPTGVITCFTNASGALTTTTFTVTNSLVTTSSVVTATIENYSGTFVTNGIPVVSVSNLTAGTFDLKVVNCHATVALNGILKIAFIVA